jgi:predicted DNA-binding transcriptional regulator YafY
VREGIAWAALKLHGREAAIYRPRIAGDAAARETGRADMHPIDRAIREKRRLRFIYHGVARLVEPQCHGIGHRGTNLLRAHQLQGGAQAEPLFDVSKISDLQVLDERFEKPGPNYKRNDSAMREIFAQL